MGSDYYGYELFFSGWGRCYRIRQRSWLHNLGNILKTTKLFLLNGWIWWYVNYLKTNTQANQNYQVPFLARHLQPSSYLTLIKQILFPFSRSGNGGIDLKRHPASKYGWGLNTDLSQCSHHMQQAVLPTLQSNPVVRDGYSKLMVITTAMTKDKPKHKLMTSETRKKSILGDKGVSSYHCT